MTVKKTIYLTILVFAVISITYAMTGLRKGGSNSCSISAVEFKSIDTEKVVILDVRTLSEFNAGHVAGAVLIDIYKKDFPQRINRLDKEKMYYVYCKTGSRSGHATRYMEQSGFSNVCNVVGGINQLKKAGISLVK